jgi:hypothetical protein
MFGPAVGGVKHPTPASLAQPAADAAPTAGSLRVTPSCLVIQPERIVPRSGPDLAEPGARNFGGEGFMNRVRRSVLIAAVFAVVLSAAGRAADATDPLVGTWKLNLARSSFQPGPGPKGQLRIYRRSEDAEQLVSRGVGADGKPTLVQYTARYDDKDHHMTGSSGGDQIQLKRVDALTTQSIQKRDGKAAIIATRTVSQDGRTLTVVTKGTTATGETIDATMVFDRN